MKTERLEIQLGQFLLLYGKKDLVYEVIDISGGSALLRSKDRINPDTGELCLVTFGLNGILKNWEMKS